MVAAVVRFLANVAGPAGTLLVLDDLQWAGADALDLLVTLVRAAAPDGSSALTAGGGRLSRHRGAAAGSAGGAAGGPGACRLAAQPRWRRCARRRPGSCSMPCWSGETEVAPELRARVLRRAGGVPFFLVSSAQALPREDGTGGEEDAVPWNVAQGLRQRVAGLPAAAREVLGVAAVLGREVHPAILTATVEHGEHEVLEALDAATQARLLVAQGETYEFAHDVIREVVEADLGPARRMVVHRRIAEALERRPDAAGVEALAYHFRRSGSRRRRSRIWCRQASGRKDSMRMPRRSSTTARRWTCSTTAIRAAWDLRSIVPTRSGG